MTVLSALVYERDGELVKEAYDVFVESPDTTNGPGVDGDNGDLPSSTEEKMRDLLSRSEKRIRDIAEPYGLQFEGKKSMKLVLPCLFTCLFYFTFRHLGTEIFGWPFLWCVLVRDSSLLDCVL